MRVPKSVQICLFLPKSGGRRILIQFCVLRTFDQILFIICSDSRIMSHEALLCYKVSEISSIHASYIHLLEGYDSKGSSGVVTA